MTESEFPNKWQHESQVYLSQIQIGDQELGLGLSESEPCDHTRTFTFREAAEVSDCKFRPFPRDWKIIRTPITFTAVILSISVQIQMQKKVYIPAKNVMF